MIKDCLEVFKKNLEAKGERYILDNYIPKDGTYILVKMVGNQFEMASPLDVIYDKKNKVMKGKEDGRFSMICAMDYYSKLIEMNKPMDSGKIIHSNNYLSFVVKKESIKNEKLTQSIIDGYYGILLDPSEKYKKSKKSSSLYNEVVNDIGLVDQSFLEAIHKWIIDNIFTLEVNLDKKDYLKIFFMLENEQETRNLYAKEYKRYLLPNIYNSNDFNVEIENHICGLPNDNMGMNSKKPYLANKNRGQIEVPYLINQENALLQVQFFDYLQGLASKGKYNIYFDIDNITIKGYGSTEGPEAQMHGYFLRIQKGKELEIHNCDTVVSYNPNLIPTFYYRNIIRWKGDEYGESIKKRKELEMTVNDVLFGGKLIYNYFTDSGDLKREDSALRNNLIVGRDQLFSWFYKNEGADISEIMQMVSTALIKDSVSKGYRKKAKKQLNLKWSFKDYFLQNREMEERMNRVEENFDKHVERADSWDFDGDDAEYYFAVGQVVYCLIIRNKGKKTPFSLANTFFNAKSDKIIKRELTSMFKKYSYDISIKSMKLKNVLSRILLYQPEAAVNQDMILAGLMSNNAIVKHEEKEEELVNE